MKIHQVRWCMLNKLEIRFQYVTNTLQYVGIRCHMTKWSENFVLFYTTGIIPFSDCGEFAASLVSGVVSFMLEGRVGSVKG